MSVDGDRRSLLFGIAAAAPFAALGACATGGTSAVAEQANALQPPSIVEGGSLAQAAGRNGRFYGSAARIDQLMDQPALSEATVRDCSYLSPEIHLKWNSLEYHRREFNYASVDDLLDFADAHGMGVRGHTLIWDQSTPDWAKAEMLETRDWEVLAGHFRRTLGRYRGRIWEWDVVNEALDTENGDGVIRRNTFQRAYGSTYIERALEEARTLAPDAHLIINDYSFEYDNPVDAARRRAFVALIERLKAQGTPLDGVGLQAHLDLAKGPLHQRAYAGFMQALADTGVDLVISELDVKERDRSPSLDRRDLSVADETRRFLEVALDQKAVRGVVTWGLSDRYSWLSDDPGRADPRLNRGLPLSGRYAIKPMYWAVHDSFAAAAPVTRLPRAA